MTPVGSIPKITDCMTIPKNKMAEIRQLREPGDVSKLSEITRVPKSTLYVVLRTGVCSPTVASSVLKFYRVRKQERKALQSLLEDHDND